VGETRVDLVHLLEDLADAYPGELEETVLTEIVANALDSGATTIALRADPAASTLTVLDDGRGMRRIELRRFHDIAATTKARGEGIGFAGVGIKLGLLLSDEVVTESRRAKHHVSTTWKLTSRHRAPWSWIPPGGLVAEHGTAVRLTLRNALSPLLDSGFLETMLRRHFEPLFDPFFDEILGAHYPAGIRFELNGSGLDRADAPRAGIAPIAARLARRRKPSAVGYLDRASAALPEERRGVAISTFGKVIKRGWDWLGVSPLAPDRVTGLIEVPALAAALTLNKIDFLRSGARGAVYMAYRKALQEAVSEQLTAWGDDRGSDDKAHRRAARPVERDMEAVLLDLAEQFPMLAFLVERRAGGQRKLPAVDGWRDDPRADTIDLFAATAAVAPASAEASPPPEETGEPDAESESTPEPVQPPSEDATEPGTAVPVEPPARTNVRRPTRLGLTIQFESRPDDPELGRLIETTVWVNESHPAHQRAIASRSEGYHLALSVALALASVAVEPPHERAFVTEFLARWGASTQKPKRRGSGRRKGRG
jgi:hypothetical protein